MKRLISLFLSFLFFIPSALAVEDAPKAADAETCNATCKKIQEIANQSPYVVAVIAHKESGGSGMGTGILIKEGGSLYILTNNHVIDRPLASKIWISFHKRGFMQEVFIAGRDPALDLVLLTAPALPLGGVQPAILGDSLKVGEQAYALGYPFGVRSVTFGFVNVLESDSWLHAWTQVPLNPGSSGGPLFNEKHEVVGINTAVLNPTLPGAAISFVIPIEHVRRALPRLMRERLVRRGEAGFAFRNASDIPPIFFEQHGINYPPPRDDIVVVKVLPGSSADRAGIRNGDVIVKFNGQTPKSAKDLDMKIFFDHRPEQEVLFTIQRGSQLFEKRVVLSEYSPPGSTSP